MYPEGSLIDPEEKNLLLFKHDSMNPLNEGFVELWSVMSNTSKQFRFRKRLSKVKAQEKWNYLEKHGWAIIGEEEIAA
tara:strand:+ start:2672 stop:2905 length:234 start_codon:yes stop_codon:yes gene_type:complete